MASRVLKKGKNRITQGYKSTHRGVDLGREHLTGEPVIAHTEGRVTFCQTGKTNSKGATGNASYGNCVKLDHGDGYETLYAHLDEVHVTNGEYVTAGQPIGTMGNTGNSYGMHLHFEVRKDKERIDPTPYLEADLPLNDAVHITYRAYTCGKWLPKVTDFENESTSGYAGIAGKEISAVQITASDCLVKYRAHVCGGGWLSWVTSEKSWAGVRGKPIDAVQMKSEKSGYKVKYRVSPASCDKWYQWCTDCKDSTGDGYAGVFGQPIDRVQIMLEKE